MQTFERVTFFVVFGLVCFLLGAHVGEKRVPQPQSQLSALEEAETLQAELRVESRERMEKAMERLASESPPAPRPLSRQDLKDELKRVLADIPARTEPRTLEEVERHLAEGEWEGIPIIEAMVKEERQKLLDSQ